MIVKDEELVIERCLRSIAPCMDEIVVVDTGSSDKTTEIIERLAAEPGMPPIRLHSFEWTDDFAAARNFSFSKSTTDYVGWVDADETFPQALIDTLNEMKQRDFDGLATIATGIVFQYGNKKNGYGTRTRFVRRRTDGQPSYWLYPVHELYVTEKPEVLIQGMNRDVLHEKLKEDNFGYYAAIYYGQLNRATLERNHHNGMYMAWTLMDRDPDLARMAAFNVFLIAPDRRFENADYRKWFGMCGLFDADEHASLVTTSLCHDPSHDDLSLLLDAGMSKYAEGKYLSACCLWLLPFRNIGTLDPKEQEDLLSRLPLALQEAGLQFPRVRDAIRLGRRLCFENNRFVSGNNEWLDRLEKSLPVAVVSGVSLSRCGAEPDLFYLGQFCRHIIIIDDDPEHPMQHQILTGTLATREEAKKLAEKIGTEHVLLVEHPTCPPLTTAMTNAIILDLPISASLESKRMAGIDGVTLKPLSVYLSEN